MQETAAMPVLEMPMHLGVATLVLMAPLQLFLETALGKDLDLHNPPLTETVVGLVMMGRAGARPTPPPATLEATVGGTMEILPPAMILHLLVATLHLPAEIQLHLVEIPHPLVATPHPLVTIHHPLTAIPHPLVTVQPLLAEIPLPLEMTLEMTPTLPTPQTIALALVLPAVILAATVLGEILEPMIPATAVRTRRDPTAVVKTRPTAAKAILIPQEMTMVPATCSVETAIMTLAFLGTGTRRILTLLWATYSGSAGNAAGGSVAGSSGLVNIMSNNAGDGGMANSGDAMRRDTDTHTGPGGDASGGSVYTADDDDDPTEFSQFRRTVQQFRRAEAYSGSGGKAPGGSVNSQPALINLISSDGGRAKSGSVRGRVERRGNAYSGPGGNAAGGSVYGGSDVSDFNDSNAGDRERSSFSRAHGRDMKRDSAYSGSGGNATGGSVFSGLGHGGLDLISLLSNNAGDGGDAKSGNAVSRRAFVERDSYSGMGGNASGGSAHGVSGLVNVLFGNAGNGGHATSGSVHSRDFQFKRGTAYSGAGGNATGGDVEGGGGMLTVGSGSAGDGGDATSGNAIAHGGSSTAYSGAGGQASGGSIKTGYRHRLLGSGAASVGSGNAGDGGEAGSGDSSS
ncbi:hypothetical protein BV25DRAFT_887017 [Artomyces pyxidatus]|uniref:Uncharacterized protein n=1 Tax=Artomyces pyxidatus TaxID=48021 RepID=A0ACB8THL2_9AGAM|nr:hypothetical protein BV25DRAFT_887017 [Artomyces pyxidatus]